MNYLKENNSTDSLTDFELKWSELVQTVKQRSRKEAELCIKTFVLWLRNIRHNELCTGTNAKKSLEKNDRQHYRADGILILLKSKSADEIAKFKKYTEEYTGDLADDAKWVKRWNAFLTAVDSEISDEKKKEVISKFLIAQRKKKFDKSK